MAVAGPFGRSRWLPVYVVKALGLGVVLQVSGRKAARWGGSWRRITTVIWRAAGGTGAAP